MLNILFVDDEQNVLAAVRRNLRLYRNRWNMDFATSSQEAMELLAWKKYDLILSDLSMPGVDGVELLRKVKDQSPETVRVILTGATEYATITALTDVAHRLITKPCEPNQFKEIVMRLCHLQEALPDQSARRKLVQRNSLPHQPELFLELKAAAENENSTTRTYAGIVAKDIALTAKVIQLANSSYFGAPRRITELDLAIGRLGIDTVVSLALSIGMANQYEGRVASTQLEALSMHSLEVAQLATQMADVLPIDESVTREVFLAGLLHDCGKLLLADNSDETEYEIIRELSSQFEAGSCKVERTAFGFNHPEAGGLVLDLWGLPLTVVEAVAFHHKPGQTADPESNAAAVIHVADLISHLKIHRDETLFDAHLDHEVICRLGWQNHIENWKQLVLDNPNEVKN